MEEKKHKSIEIIKPSARRVLSFKNMKKNIKTKFNLSIYLQKLKTLTSKPLFIVAMILLVIGISFQLFVSLSKSATFGWIQTTWVGGADTNAKANHATDRTTWTKYYSKDAVLQATTNVQIVPTNNTTTHTNDADFDGTDNNTKELNNSVMMNF